VQAIQQENMHRVPQAQIKGNVVCNVLNLSIRAWNYLFATWRLRGNLNLQELQSVLIQCAQVF